MTTIQNHIHKFNSNGIDVTLKINCIDNYWTCDVVEGKSAIGRVTGGVFSSLDDYIKYMEKRT